MIMKLKNIFLALGGAMLLSCSMASCSDEEVYDFDGIPYNRVYFANANVVTTGAVIKTPVGNFTSLDATKTIKTTAPTTKAIQVKFAIDNSLIEAYNEKNNTEYVAAPDGVFTLSTDRLTIEADTTASKEGIGLVISEAGVEQLQPGNDYLVPVVIAGSDDDNFRPSSNVGFAYYLVSVTQKLVNDEGSLDGLTLLDKTGWTVSCTDDGATNLQNIVDGSDATYAKFTRGDNHEIVVDLGSETAFMGIEIYGRYWYMGLDGCELEYSTDGSTWNGIGTVANSYSSSLSCVLYGSIKARYVRIKGTFVYNYSWATSYWRMYEFKLYN